MLVATGVTSVWRRPALSASRLLVVGMLAGLVVGLLGMHVLAAPGRHGTHRVSMAPAQSEAYPVDAAPPGRTHELPHNAPGPVVGAYVDTADCHGTEPGAPCLAVLGAGPSPVGSPAARPVDWSATGAAVTARAAIASRAPPAPTGVRLAQLSVLRT